MRSNIIVEAQEANNLGLRVPDGESLLLLGGDIIVDGGRLNAWGGRIEIGAITSMGFVTLKNNSLSVPDSVQRGNIRLSNGSFVDVQLSDGGDIRLLADDISEVNP